MIPLFLGGVIAAQAAARRRDESVRHYESLLANQAATRRRNELFLDGELTKRSDNSTTNPPPPELVQEWGHDANLSGVPYDDKTGYWAYEQHIAACAAQWGADQELEACIEWLEQNQGRWEIPMALREGRRPKPLSLKEQALSDLKNAYNADMIDDTTFENIRRALEGKGNG